MALNSQQLAMEIVAKDLATATLQRVNANVENFTQTAGRATQGSIHMGEGLKKASNALNAMAGDLIGVNGKVGRLAEGLLAFAGGGALVTAVALGITAIAGAVYLAGKEMREAKKHTDEFLASLNKASSLATVGAEIDLLRQRIADRSAKISKGLFFGSSTAQAEDRARLAELERVYQQLYVTGRQTAITEGRKVAAQALKDANDATRAASDRALSATARIPVAQVTGPGLEPLKVLEAFPPGTIDALAAEFPPFTANVTDATTHLSYLAGAMDDVATATSGIFEGLVGLGEVVGGRFGDTARKIIAPFAKIEGTYFIIKGLAKIADSLFPPNPAGLSSGAGMIARGRQLVSLAGGGASYGGAAGGGGAGGLGPGQQTIAQQQGEVNVQLKKGYVDSTDPDFQDFLVETLRGAGNRRVTVTYV